MTAEALTLFDSPTWEPWCGHCVRADPCGCSRERGRCDQCKIRGRAIGRLMAVAGNGTNKWADPVAYWDARTAGNDARTALSIAFGAPLDAIDPADGTWSRRSSS